MSGHAGLSIALDLLSDQEAVVQKTQQRIYGELTLLAEYYVRKLNELGTQPTSLTYYLYDPYHQAASQQVYILRHRVATATENGEIVGALYRKHHATELAKWHTQMISLDEETKEVLERATDIAVQNSSELRDLYEDLRDAYRTHQITMP